MLSLHCCNCKNAFFTCNENQLDPNTGLFGIHMRETTNLKISEYNLIRCKSCNLVLGRTENSELLHIPRNKTILFISASATSITRDVGN